MTSTFDNVLIPPNEWVDVYELASIDKGSKVIIENIGVCDVYYSTFHKKPEIDHDAYNIIKRDGQPIMYEPNGSVLWAFCSSLSAKLNVNLQKNSTLDDVVDTLNRSFTDSIAMLNSLDRNISLLNMRVEEAFNTGYTKADL
jgi:hypothetical protein